MLERSSPGEQPIGAQSNPESRIGRALVAVLGPPLIGVVFIPIFRMIQSVGRPRGSLEGLDLTRFAERDELVFRVFGVTLLVFALIVGGTARTWSSRAVYTFVAALAGLCTLAAVFVALMAA